ncbi:MAG: hypothetical protein QM447_03030, partial [Thermotogota bacterium]|nr:hypothetical protein [Thermotogota bacterium]
SAFYNQISGKDITAFLDSSELKRLEVNGNAETVYFIRDEQPSHCFLIFPTVPKSPFPLAG